MERTEYFDRLHRLWGHERYLKLSPFYLMRKRLILKLVGKPDETSRLLLDIGCGVGGLLKTLVERGFFCDGLDLSPFALRIAKSEVKVGNFLLSDARFLPYRSGSYHVVVCSEVLEHIHDDQQVLREIFRVLKPNGTAILTAPHGDKYWTVEDEVDGHLRRYSKLGFVSLAERSGFEIKMMVCWGFPLAILFRRFISSPMFKRGWHKSMSRVSEFLLFKLSLFLLVNFLRIDNIFNGFSFGLGLAAKIKKRSLGT